MDQRSREIRTILMGFVNYRDRFVVAADDVLQSSFLGLYNGASSARIHGLKEIRKQYRLTTGRVYGNEQIARAMLAMGQMVYLFSANDTSAVLYRPLLLNPVMITAEADKRDALFCFYTAKTPWATLMIRIAIRKLEAGFPEDFKETPVTMTPSVIEPEESPKPKREKKSANAPQADSEETKEQPETAADDTAVPSEESEKAGEEATAPAAAADAAEKDDQTKEQGTEQ